LSKKLSEFGKKIFSNFGNSGKFGVTGEFWQLWQIGIKGEFWEFGGRKFLAFFWGTKIFGDF